MSALLCVLFGVVALTPYRLREDILRGITDSVGRFLAGVDRVKSPGKDAFWGEASDGLVTVLANPVTWYLGYVLLCSLWRLFQWLDRRLNPVVEAIENWRNKETCFLSHTDPFGSERRRMFPESMIAGSTIVNRPIVDKPSNAIIVHVDIAGVWVAVGDALRIGNHLVTPYHLLQGQNKFMVYDRNGKQVFFDLFNSEGEPQYRFMLTDLCAFQLSLAKLADLGLKDSRVGAASDGGLCTAFSACKQKSSYGKVNVDPKCPYILLYHGSTQPGFSGCGYYIGKILVGIHVCGGSSSFNYGFSASLIKKMLKPKPEAAVMSTEVEYLKKLYNSGKLKSWDLIDTDFVGYYDGNKWQLANMSSFEEAFADLPEWDEQLDSLLTEIDVMNDVGLTDPDYWQKTSKKRLRDRRLVRAPDYSDDDDDDEDLYFEGDFDALDVQRPVFKDKPTLDYSPDVTPDTRAATSTLAQGAVGVKGKSENLRRGLPPAVEPPRVQTSEAEIRVSERDLALKRVSDLALKRSTLAQEVTDNAMTLTNLSESHPVRETLMEDQKRLHRVLASLNKELREANMAAEKLKELTPSEKKNKRRKKKEPKPLSDFSLLQQEIAELRKQLKATDGPERREMELLMAEKRKLTLQLETRRRNNVQSAGTSSNTLLESVL